MNHFSLIKILESVYINGGYPLIFAASFIEISPFGFLIPGGLIIALGGFFSFNNSISLSGVIFSGFFGMMTTFYLGYLLGNKTGNILIKRLHQEKIANKAKILLDKHGAIILTTSLLANLTRFWVAYVAGIQKYNLLKFSLYATIASFAWNSLLATIGYIAGNERQKLETGLARLGIIAWGLLFLAILVIYLKSKKEFSELEDQK